LKNAHLWNRGSEYVRVEGILKVTYDNDHISLSVVSRAGHDNIFQTKTRCMCFYRSNYSASMISIPAPPYSLMRPESLAPSMYEVFAHGASQFSKAEQYILNQFLNCQSTFSPFL
jgi:hypothetical protein